MTQPISLTSHSFKLELGAALLDAKPYNYYPVYGFLEFQRRFNPRPFSLVPFGPHNHRNVLTDDLKTSITEQANERDAKEYRFAATNVEMRIITLGGSGAGNAGCGSLQDDTGELSIKSFGAFRTGTAIARYCFMQHRDENIANSKTLPEDVDPDSRSGDEGS
ncbi:hypothetical protein H0H93_000497 [Arthromyces matolae]|nr:hypothetical protein H0H93_000497 [Arthromyces matolae]